MRQKVEAALRASLQREPTQIEVAEEMWRLLLGELEDLATREAKTMSEFVAPVNLLNARKVLGLTQAQMAVLIGIDGTGHRQSYDRIEKGTRRARASHLRLIRAYLDGYRPMDWPR